MSPNRIPLARLLSLLLLTLTLTACGGGGGGSDGSPTYTVGGSVSGLTGTLVLQNNGGDNLTLTGDGSFTFATPLDSGGSYLVTVLSQPSGQRCRISNGSGTLAGDITTVSVSCEAAYTLGGKIFGVTGSVVLQNNAGDDLTLTERGDFVFATPMDSGDSYDVTVVRQPAGTSCGVYRGNGTAGADVTDVRVFCITTLSMQGHYGEGLPNSVATQGDYAYIGAVGGLLIVDISTPADPQPVSFFSRSSRLNSNTYGVAVRGDYVYMANCMEGIGVVDVSDPTAPVLVGTVPDNNHWLESIALSGDYAYGVGGGSGLFVYDISDPTAPTLVGRLATSDYNLDSVVVSGNLAYAIGNAGLHVINISDPTAPVEAGYYAITGYDHDVTVSGGYAYVTSSGYLIAVDVSDPAAPAQVGSLASDNRDLAVSGNYLYVSGKTLEIVDISDPSALSLVGSLATPDGKGVTVSGNHAYVAATGHGFSVIDITDATAPSVVGHMSTAGAIRHIELSGDYAYLADRTNGMQVLDIATPDPTYVSELSPTELLHPSVVPQTLDVAVSGNYAYVAADYGGLDLVDVSDPARPRRVGGLVPYQVYPFRVEVRGSYAYIADGQDYPASLKIADVSDPANPTLVGSVSTSSDQPGDLAVSGDYAYHVSQSDTFDGIELIDISNPAAPALVNTISSDVLPWNVTTGGNRLYVGTNNSALQVFDITTPTAPVQAGTVGKRSYDAVVVDNYAYIAAGEDGLRIYDVTDPAYPVPVAVYTANKGAVTSVAVDGRGVYTGEYGYGLVRLPAYP